MVSQRLDEKFNARSIFLICLFPSVSCFVLLPKLTPLLKAARFCFFCVESKTPSRVSSRSRSSSSSTGIAVVYVVGISRCSVAGNRALVTHEKK